MSKSKCSEVKSLIQDCSYKNDFIPLCNGKQTLWIVPKKLSSLKKWIWCSFEKHNIQHWEIANKDRLTCSASCIFATFLQLFHNDFKLILKEHSFFHKPMTWNIQTFGIEQSIFLSRTRCTTLKFVLTHLWSKC